MMALALSGVLVTLHGGNEISRQTWSDDGTVLSSEITVAGNTVHLSIDRKQRTLSGEQRGKTFSVPLPPGSAPLVNLDWAGCAVLAEWFKDASRPTPFKAVVSPSATVDGTVTVAPAAGGGKQLTIVVRGVTVTVDVDARGAVSHAAVPQQDVEVKPVAPGAARVREPPREPPAGIAETPIQVDSGGARLAGVVWRPAKVDRPLPLVIVIAGSGEVDRDGNSGSALRTDAYRLLAAALAERQVASLRYDKRGVGDSTLGKPVAELTFDDYVADAAAMVAMARKDPQVASVVLFGHSEGSLIALEVAARARVDGIVSAAGAGRPLVELAREQLARQLPAGEMAEYDRLAAAVRDGKPVQTESQALQRLFSPGLARFVRGLFFTDPRPLARAYAGKLTVVQGDNDIQVTVDKDARPLAAAHPGARLVVLRDVTHALKVDPVKGLAQPSYRDPKLPLAPGVVDAVMATLH